jgi:hypothetical protein
MKTQILLFLIRLIRFLRKENQLIPELSCIPNGKVQVNRLYNHYGRILVSRPWENAKMVKHYFVSPLQRTELSPSTLALEDRDDVPWEEVDEFRYYEARRNKELCLVRIKGRPCELCACWEKGLPCRCDFTTGTATGYFKLVLEKKQFADI